MGWVFWLIRENKVLNYYIIYPRVSYAEYCLKSARESGVEPE